MNLSISKVASLTGVSVRTLHYYDEIGLLCPSMISDTGYRYYDEEAVERLQQILFYRELDFPLKDISNIMNAPNYDKEEALIRQRNLLQMKRNRLDGLIELLDANLKGDHVMSFKEFDMSEIEAEKKKYEKEVKEKWGDTHAFKESEERTSKYTKSDWETAKKEADKIFESFAEKVGTSADSDEVQQLVEQWKNYITRTYYNCTNEILAGLGQMYIADERFKHNLDQFKDGTAQLMSDAIAVYVKQ